MFCIVCYCAKYFNAMAYCEHLGVEYILHALTYIVLSYFSVKWFIEIVLKSNMKDYRIILVKFFQVLFSYIVNFDISN